MIADSQNALDYQRALHDLSDADGEKLFPGGVEIPGGMSKNQFRIVATLKEPDEDEPAPRRAGDPAELIASNKKAKELLGWTPKHSDVKTILRDAWNWECNRKY